MKQIFTAALYIVGVVAIFALVSVLSNWQVKGDEDRINMWLSKRNLVSAKTESCIFLSGPFWYVDDDDRVYRVQTTDEKVIWFRINWGVEAVEEEKK